MSDERIRFIKQDMPLCFSSIIKSLSRFNKLFNVVRIVDPLSKKLVFYEDKLVNKLEEPPPTCYDFWRKNTHCDNCVSMRANKEENTFVKIEFNKNKIYMIMASPIELDGTKYVLELLKDITETGIIQDLKGKSVADINRIINDMNQEVILDELTKVYNRRYINERLPVDIYNHFIEQKPLSVVMTDIDDFKYYNDTYGHVAGDFILAEFAQILSTSIRKNFDWVARYGGEEFLIVLLNVDRDVAANVAENLRKTVEDKKFCHNEDIITITASFGVYTLDSDKLTVEELLTEVDQNLYKAKNSGKNMIID